MSNFPAKRSAAAHPYLSHQNNAFEPITELYLAIINAWWTCYGKNYMHDQMVIETWKGEDMDIELIFAWISIKKIISKLNI